MSCPWAKIEKPEPVNLTDVMSEELAREMQEKEYKKLQASALDTTEAEQEAITSVENLLPSCSVSVDDDEMIAKMLQIQFDKEYDEYLALTERKYNGGSKVSVSFENYKRTPLNPDFESDTEEEEIIDVSERKFWDRFEHLEKEYASIPPCGYKVEQNGNVVTKHDMTMSGRKNACKLMSFPPEFQTGDGENFDLKISNKVFNSLKMYSFKEQARRYKIHDRKEDHATAEFGMDEHTRLLIYKLINKQLLERVDGVVSIGKEAVVLHAETDPCCPDTTPDTALPKECAIKVFKTVLSEFKDRDKYIKDDRRFKDRMGKQTTTRKIVHLWAEKEMANLSRMQKVGLRCPQVVKLKNHVLIMSFIGENNVPAPKLKDADLDEDDAKRAYKEVIESMRTLYQNANLIHADLSEYNILYHNKHCYFIDVSQAVEPCHENAFFFLMRDCENISKVSLFNFLDLPNDFFIL
ncbi:unnamed protein product [Acanthoscelides obtectus]|uniref:Serine/threonine-protein kinase RIO3 n=2 Tax=Acanthoscelides obtectus TaxID=200917 RepID=A0A9P0LR41_ACAOB|nr:unnamed protein product [Acanthoscelides obtectus]CAK1679825.1 Serine/threonine-protein kinase RIO3 [Acanthoscelides obtectus]